MKLEAVSHEFVDFIPPELDEGILYVSIPYATAVHLCACGCGNTVVTPISPAQWQLLYDGESISLTPSIGNWQLPCHSHYWICQDQVRWARQWTDKEIAEGRRRDAQDLEHYFGDRAVAGDDAAAPGGKLSRSIWDRLLRFLGRR